MRTYLFAAQRFALTRHPLMPRAMHSPLGADNAELLTGPKRAAEG